MPAGTNKKFLSHANKALNQIIGGWQISMLSRHRSGLPSTIQDNGVYPTNYLTSAIVIPKPGVAVPQSGSTFDQNGLPSVFHSTSVSNAYIEQYRGETGTRAIVRLSPFTNFDLARQRVSRCLGKVTALNSARKHGRHDAVYGSNNAPGTDET